MLEGDINQIHLIERLVELWQEQFTGAIRFENDGIIKIIYFKGGDVLSASTNDRADSVDEILMRAGKVSREHVKQALARRKESETLGDAMLNLGYITRKELTWARRVQVVGVIRSIAGWTEGSFTIVADYLPKRDEGTLFPLPQILVELIVTEQDRQKFDRAMAGGAEVFEKSGDFAAVFGRLGLNEDAEAIIAQVDGTRSASEVAASSGRDAFNVYKLLHALATLGILRKPKPQVTPEVSYDDDFAAIGAADAADVWDYDTPDLQIDEGNAKHPTLDVPSMTFDADETAALSSPMFPSSHQAGEPEEREVEAEAVTEVAAMPPWSPATTVAVPLPTLPVEPPTVTADGEQWGFEDTPAQPVKVSGPASAPEPIPTPVYRTPPPARQAATRAGGGGKSLLIAALVIVVLAGGGYGGFLWWQQQRGAGSGAVAATAGSPAAVPPSRPPEAGTMPASPTPSPAITETIGTTTATSTMAASTTAPEPATTTTGATATIAPEISTAAPSTPALPAVIPRNVPVQEQARNHAANPQGNFTVQIQILCDPANVEKAVRAGGDNVWFVPQTLGARSCYRIFWGRFDTREEAQAAMGSVPRGLRDPSAAVRPVPKP